MNFESNPIEKLCKDSKYCLNEISNIRQAIGSIHATDKTFENALKSLIFMRLYAPVEILSLIDSQITETETRNTYRIMKPFRSR